MQCECTVAVCFALVVLVVSIHIIAVAAFFFFLLRGPSIYYVCTCREPSINDHLLVGEGSIFEEILMFS